MNITGKSSQVTPLHNDEINNLSNDEIRDNSNHSENLDGFYSDDNEESSTQPSINRLFGLLGRNKLVNRILNSLTYTNLKESTIYFLDTCNVVHIKLKFDDVMMILSIFAIFINNIEVLISARGQDYYFKVASTICMLIFSLELLVNTWAKTTYHINISFYPTIDVNQFKIQGYLFSFYFWLDVIVILSFIPNMIWFNGPLKSYLDESRSSNVNYVRMVYTARIVRLVKFIRIARKFKLSSDRKAREAREQDLRELVRMGAINFDEVDKQLALYNERESKLGSQLSESITRRVVIIILLLISLVPYLLWHTQNPGQEYALGIIQSVITYPNSYINETAKRAVIDQVIQTFDSSYHQEYVLYLNMEVPVGYSIGSSIYVNQKHLLKRLPSTLIQYLYAYDTVYNYNSSSQSFQSDSFIGYSATDFGISNLSIETLGSQYNMILTVYIAIFLVLGTYLLIKGVHTLIIEPIDRMLNLVEAVAKNPLRQYSFAGNSFNEGTGEYEIKLLQSTISKVTSLLRVCFGEAGAGIISANLTTTHNTTSINPLLPGIRVYAIFGFCDILKFEDINQRLEGDVLTFVNTLAEIVHGCVHTWGGQCNKNLGNAFVIVWRIGDEKTLLNILYKYNLSNGNMMANNTTYGQHHHGSNNNNGYSTTYLKHNTSPHSRQSVIGLQSNDDYRPNRGSMNRDISSHDSYMNQHAIHGTQPGITLPNISSRSSSISQVAGNGRRLMNSLANGMLRGLPGRASTSLNSTGLNSNYQGLNNPHGNSFLSSRGLNISNHESSSVMNDIRDSVHEYTRKRGQNIDLRRVPGVDVLADKALISYLKIIVEINRSKEISKYNKDPRLTLNNTEVFKVRMGFGLHAGWAIEGAVGSLQKVDATYLSPHVNLASRLESASKQYGTPILLSQNFYDLLSVAGQEHCRKIDVVKFKGSDTPIGIYTWDTLEEQEFSVDDRKAKRRSSIANLEKVVEENFPNIAVNVLNTQERGSNSNNTSTYTNNSNPFQSSSMNPIGTQSNSIFGRRLSHSIHLPNHGPSRKYSFGIFPTSSQPSQLINNYSINGINASSNEGQLTSNSSIANFGSMFSLSGQPSSSVLSPSSSILHIQQSPKPSMLSSSTKASKARGYRGSAMTAAAAAAAEAVGITMGQIDSTSTTTSSLTQPNQTILGQLPQFQSNNQLSLMNPSVLSSIPGNNSGYASAIGNTNNNSSISTPVMHINTSIAPSPMTINPSSSSQPQQIKIIQFFTPNDDTMETFTKDYDLTQLRSHIHDDFKLAFRDGFNAYISGDWNTAKLYLEKANKYMRQSVPAMKGDGPSLTLLEYMAKHDYQSPLDWKGFRKLESK